MPVDDSRLPGFFRLSLEERRQLLSQVAGLNTEDISSLSDGGGLEDEMADKMVENVVGTMALPVGLATNFIIDHKPYLIPYCIEESSVIAAASNIAKRCHAKGGFRTEVDDSIMIGQIQLIDVPDIEKATNAILDNADSLVEICNSLPSTMVKLGGGCKEIRCRPFQEHSMLIVHILVDCKDAMGANAVNTMAELVAPKIEELSGGRANLRILSNLAIHRLARSRATFTAEELSNGGGREEGLEIISGILEAFRFASVDPFRATTHNKGTMNAISAIALACGQDWRAVEASCHAWVSHDQGRYGSLAKWWQNEDGDLEGSIELPLAVGIVGGATKVHPAARTNLKILGVDSARELAGVMACAGLAQNLGAMRALSTTGIQSGHMRLHLRNMAISSGAKGEEIEAVADMVNESGQPVTQSLIDSMLAEYRKG